MMCTPIYILYIVQEWMEEKEDGWGITMSNKIPLYLISPVFKAYQQIKMYILPLGPGHAAVPEDLIEGIVHLVRNCQPPFALNKLIL